MIDRIKWYFAEVVVPKYIPVAIMAALGMLGTFMMAHAEILERFGITYGNWPIQGFSASGPVIVVELATLSKAAATALAALVVTVITAIQHHTTGGAKLQLPGGRRETDPPGDPPKAA